MLAQHTGMGTHELPKKGRVFSRLPSREVLHLKSTSNRFKSYLIFTQNHFTLTFKKKSNQHGHLAQPVPSCQWILRAKFQAMS